MSDTHVTVLPTPLSNIHQYKALVETFPRLEEDEERSLAQRYRAENDLESAWRLVTSHLRYVVYIARSYSGYGLPQEDLIQEGNVGLMKAVQRFDPARGVRLAVYASYWIRAHILEFVLKNWRIVRVATTKAKRKLFYKLRSSKQRLEWLKQDEADAIAKNLDVGVDDVIDMEQRLYLIDESFDPPGDTSQEEQWAPTAYLKDDRFEPESIVAEHEIVDRASGALKDALATLDRRSQDIIVSRWLADEEERLTLTELADRYGVSAERIRQLESKAIEHLREVMVSDFGIAA